MNSKMAGPLREAMKIRATTPITDVRALDERKGDSMFGQVLKQLLGSRVNGAKMGGISKRVVSALLFLALVYANRRWTLGLTQEDLLLAAGVVACYVLGQSWEDSQTRPAALALEAAKLDALRGEKADPVPSAPSAGP